MSSEDGIITILNLKDGDKVVAYSLDGKIIGSVIAKGGPVQFSANADSIILLKIGNKTVRTLVN